MVRCKFKVTSKAPGEKGLVGLTPVWKSEPGVEGNAATENHVFGKWTPSGSISMQIENPEAFARFELDHDYYVDFTPAE